MWIDLIDANGPVPLHRAIQLVVDRYDASLKAEMTELSTNHYDFRHAVCIVDENGRHYARCPSIEELAQSLLVEYGTARGGTVASWEFQSWDFGTCTGYAMSYVGGPTEPTSPTRLTAEPRLFGEILRDREESYVKPRNAVSVDGD